MKANFDSAMQESQKMQSQLQALVSKTAELAQQGNPAAKAAVEELERGEFRLKGPLLSLPNETRFVFNLVIVDLP